MVVIGRILLVVVWRCQHCWTNDVAATMLFVCGWTKQPLTLLAQCCFVEAGNIGWTRGCGSGSCTHLCMFNNGGTCFDSDLVPHLNKYWELISYASKISSGPIFSLNSNCCYQRGSYFLKQTLLAFSHSCITSHTVEWSLLIFFFISRFFFMFVLWSSFLLKSYFCIYVLLSIILLFIFDITFSQRVWVINSKSGLNSRRQMLKPM